MSEGLAAEFEAGLEHIYHGGFFASRSPCAIIMRLNIRRKLIFGHRFNDKELLEDGKQSLRNT